jgi:hypothetical protein
MTQAASIVVRLTVTALAIIAIAGQVAHLDSLSGATLGLGDSLVRNPRPSFLTLVAADAVVSAISGILAIALVFRGDPARGSRGLGVALGAWSYLLAYSGVIVLLRPDPGVLRTVFHAHFSVVEVLGLAGLVEFTTVFPRRLLANDLSAPDSLPVGLRTLQQLRIRLLSPGGPWLGAAIAMFVLYAANAATGRPVADAALHPFMDLGRFLAVALVVLNVRRSWILGADTPRQQMWWIMVGLALLIAALSFLIGGNLLLNATHWQEPVIAWRPILLDLGLLGFLWGAAMSVFYDGGIDSAGVARRVFATAALGTLVLVVAAGLEILLSVALVGRISLRPGIGTLVATVVAVATYGRTLPFIEKILGQVAEAAMGGVAAD